MSFFIKEMVKRKMKQLSPSDLLHYGEQYGFTITNEQAVQITNFLRQTTLDPFIQSDRIEMFQTLSHITDEQTANQAQNLLAKIISVYGVEHLFES